MRSVMKRYSNQSAAGNPAQLLFYSIILLHAGRFVNAYFTIPQDAAWQLYLAFSAAMASLSFRRAGSFVLMEV
jgi:hypothetical protein